MSTIKGIFEPFYGYVSKQLSDRKLLISNPKGTLNETEDKNKNIISDKTTGFGFDLLENGIRSKKAFHAYTTEKQCVIRMASGVDIRKKNNLLEEDEKYHIGSILAKNWVLEGGNKTYKGFDSVYNSKRYRSNSQDGFGMVPPPGIIDAIIDTKSEDGSLREATINFVCNNKRQLEILETLYMRPGYPILLEWGWNPYISFNEEGDPINDFSVNENDFSVLGEFFDSESSINSLNDQISLYKENSEGNYDGFIGYVKNFSFKVREDGGYDCVTSVIAHGEILESLKANQLITSKLYGVRDEDIYNPTNPLDEKEITDEFSFYLKSIKANLDKAGNKAIIEYVGTDNEINLDLSREQGDPTPEQEEQARLNRVPVPGSPNKFRAYKNPNNDKELIPIIKLNEVSSDYVGGLDKIKELIKEVAKIGDDELILSKKNWEDTPPNILDTYQGTDFNFFSDNISKQKHHITTGFDPLYEGTILKEISVEDSDPDKSSGVKKKIFVRWDLICQILNKKITPEYKKNHALVELTYLNPNEPTYTTRTNLFKRDDNSNKIDSSTNKFYLQYAIPDSKTIFTTDNDNSENTRTAQDLYNETPSNLDNSQEPETTSQFSTIPPLLGQSFDTNICLMPHQVLHMKQNNSTSQRGIKQLTSFINTQTSKTDIGMVYFNLDHLISTYEGLILEEYTTTNELGDERTKRRLKKEFSFHNFITTIWNDVNDASGGFFDFGLHVEHSRPNVVRIIDFTFKGKPSDVSETRPIFNFDPQGLASIARESSFSSKLDNDFASVISVAAQSPNNIHSLEAMSFKAFHKNIKNRFTSPENDEVGLEAKRKDQYDTYVLDLENYRNTVKSLMFYLHKMNQSNYETELVVNTVFRNGKQHFLPNSTRKPTSPDTAKQFASQLEEMRNKLEARHGFINDDKYPNNKYNEGTQMNQITEDKSELKSNTLRPYIGSFREDTTYGRSAIIPITVSMTLDGIAGIHPLQIFKINPEKLPKGYQNPNIIFVVKKETNKITGGQDWTTEITGYLTLMDGNPNEGANPDYIDDTSIGGLDEILNESENVNNTPQADLLREAIEEINKVANGDILITEKFIGYEGEISSGGDINPLLVVEAENIFREIMFDSGKSITNIEITGGNDTYHQNLNSTGHKLGEALDFTFTPYNEKNKKIVEKVCTDNQNISFINEYENPSARATGPHFHISI
tara:strand:+ start:1072 stop:4665 length:3594 start_codon:yes stop_codon:yes gene_type:complete